MAALQRRHDELGARHAATVARIDVRRNAWCDPDRDRARRGVGAQRRRDDDAGHRATDLLQFPDVTPKAVPERHLRAVGIEAR